MHARTFYHSRFLHAHCASICAHHKGVLICYYRDRECSNKQHVRVEYWEDDKCLAHENLPPKTGNCVLVKTGISEATLIFSYFTDTDGKNVPISPVQRWMYCTNWKSRVAYIDGKIALSEASMLETKPSIGMLTRCAPLYYGSGFLLPIYREHDCYGEILASEDGWNWGHHGYIGNNYNVNSGRFGSGILIQPTIWVDPPKLHSLSRDVTSNYKAWYACSVDGGRTWTKPVPSQLDNFNNSLVVAPHRQGPFVIWNQGLNRYNLVFGVIDKYLSAQPFVKLNQGISGSYPNYCWDNDNRLHIVHTDSGQIAHHILDMEAINLLMRETAGPKTISDYHWWTT